MGYKIPNTGRVYHLQFADEDMAGLEITVRAIPIGRYEASEDGDNVLEVFAESLVSWNVEDAEDRPVPATIEGIKLCDTAWLVQRVLPQWRRTILGYNDPLVVSSNGGQPSGPVPLPMAPPSPNPEN